MLEIVIEFFFTSGFFSFLFFFGVCVCAVKEELYNVSAARVYGRTGSSVKDDFFFGLTLVLSLFFFLTQSSTGLLNSSLVLSRLQTRNS